MSGPTLDAVRTRAELIAHDGMIVDAIGRYATMPRPVRGSATSTNPDDRAAIVLSDGVLVYLEPLDCAESIRSPDERARFTGKLVRVRGTARQVMPARGESPLAPCISDVATIAETGAGLSDDTASNP